MAVHVHGSLALGGYHHGISDQDVVFLLSAPLDKAGRRLVTESHRAAGPLLSCAYVLDATEPEATHPTWTHGWSGQRRVSLITRAELAAGLTLHGLPAQQLWPVIPDLAAVVAAEVTRAWQTQSRHRLLWRKTEWVDLALTSLAPRPPDRAVRRPSSARRRHRHLRELGVDARLVDAIAARREGRSARPDNRIRRALSVRREIQRLLAALSAQGRAAGAFQTAPGPAGGIAVGSVRAWALPRAMTWRGAARPPGLPRRRGRPLKSTAPPDGAPTVGCSAVCRPMTRVERRVGGSPPIITACSDGERPVERAGAASARWPHSGGGGRPQAAATTPGRRTASRRVGRGSASARRRGGRRACAAASTRAMLRLAGRNESTARRPRGRGAAITRVAPTVHPEPGRLPMPKEPNVHHQGSSPGHAGRRLGEEPSRPRGRAERRGPGPSSRRTTRAPRHLDACHTTPFAGCARDLMEAANTRERARPISRVGWGADLPTDGSGATH